MTQRLAGEVAMITGAAGGIGGAIAARFASEGCRIISIDRVEAPSGDLTLLCDLGDDTSLAHAVDAVRASGLEPDIVVHAAAMGDACPTMDTNAAFLARMFAVNVGAALSLAQAFAPGMQARRHGCFLFVSSINSTYATPGLAAYAASKAALDSLMRTLALELAPDNVRVNSVRPASIDTPLWRRGMDAQPNPKAAIAANIKRHPLGRIGRPEDVAALALFLCSDEASWITGVDYQVDGGASVTRR
ncbi:MAG TPA: SDR family oxidoreductase [Sphingomonas sp.]|nr:SDR family oxidoreductase [Sphingomonas sp.]